MDIDWGNAALAVLPIITLLIGARLTQQTDRARYRLDAGDALAKLEPLIWAKYGPGTPWQDLRVHLGAMHVRLRLAGVPLADIRSLNKAVTWTWATVYDSGVEEVGLSVDDKAFDLFEARREIALAYLEPVWHQRARRDARRRAKELDQLHPGYKR